jgi:hypothetical protein
MQLHVDACPIQHAKTKLSSSKKYGLDGSPEYLPILRAHLLISASDGPSKSKKKKPLSFVNNQMDEHVHITP